MSFRFNAELNDAEFCLGPLAEGVRSEFIKEYVEHEVNQRLMYATPCRTRRHRWRCVGMTRTAGTATGPWITRATRVADNRLPLTLTLDTCAGVAASRKRARRGKVRVYPTWPRCVSPVIYAALHRAHRLHARSSCSRRCDAGFSSRARSLTADRASSVSPVISNNRPAAFHRVLTVSPPESPSRYLAGGQTSRVSAIDGKHNET